MNGKIFSFDDFFLVLRGFSEILVLLANLGNSILVNSISSFPNSLTSRHYFLQQYKLFVLNKIGHFVYNGSFLFIKISRNGIWSLLYFIVNCTEGLIEFKVSNNSSGLIWLLLKSIQQSSKKWFQFSLIYLGKSSPYLKVQTL